MKESRIRWTAMFALVFALGLSACGGDANGKSAEETVAKSGDAAVEASDAANEAVETIIQELPEGVTEEMVTQGETIYAGAGICSSCHGPVGAGVPSLGADLTDAEWLHSDGSYEGVVKSVMEGVTAQASSSGIPMPAKGGTKISDDDANAVAAYVWTLSK